MSRTIEILNYNESKLLLEYLLNHKTSRIFPRVTLRNYTMALVMLDTGLRVNELVNTMVHQLWVHEQPVQRLFVEDWQAKGKTPREIPLTIRVQEAIIKMNDLWWNSTTTPFVLYAFFGTQGHVHISVRRVQQIIRAAALASIGREIHPHALRHTFATRLMRRTNIRVVQDLMGHKNIQSTQIYTHPNSDDLTKAIKTLDP